MKKTAGPFFTFSRRGSRKKYARGFPRRAAKALLDAGLLIPESKQRFDMKLPREVTDLGRPRVYAVCIHEF